MHIMSLDSFSLLFPLFYLHRHPCVGIKSNVFITQDEGNGHLINWAIQPMIELYWLSTIYHCFLSIKILSLCLGKHTNPRWLFVDFPRISNVLILMDLQCSRTIFMIFWKGSKRQVLFSESMKYLSSNLVLIMSLTLLPPCQRKGTWVPACRTILTAPSPCYVILIIHALSFKSLFLSTLLDSSSLCLWQLETCSNQLILVHYVMFLCMLSKFCACFFVFSYLIIISPRKSLCSSCYTQPFPLLLNNVDHVFYILKFFIIRREREICGST